MLCRPERPVAPLCLCWRTVLERRTPDRGRRSRLLETVRLGTRVPSHCCVGSGWPCVKGCHDKTYAHLPYWHLFLASASVSGEGGHSQVGTPRVPSPEREQRSGRRAEASEGRLPRPASRVPPSGGPVFLSVQDLHLAVSQHHLHRIVPVLQQNPGCWQVGPA